MSIGLLFETQVEIRRLFIASSELASGDFRLKKILPGMKKSGEAAPIFAKIAQLLEKVIEPEPGKSSENLLELSNLVNAVLYTQGQTGLEGELKEIDTINLNYHTDTPFRRIKPLVDALTTKGPGRLEIIREAYKQKIFNDMRLVHPLITALDDTYAEIPDLVSEILVEYGPSIVPIIKKSLNIHEGKSHARRLEVISMLCGNSEKEYYLEALEKGSLDIKVAAIKALKDSPECENILLELSKERKKEIREASLYSLSILGTPLGIDRIFEVFFSKERNLSYTPIQISVSDSVITRLISEGQALLEKVLRLQPPTLTKAKDSTHEEVEQFAGILFCMESKKDERIYEFLKQCLGHMEFLDKFGFSTLGYTKEYTLAGLVISNLFDFKTVDAFMLLDSEIRKLDGRYISYAFESALWAYDPAYVYDAYHELLKKTTKFKITKEITNMMSDYVDFDRKFSFDDDYDDSYRHYTYRRMSDANHIVLDKRWIQDLIAVNDLYVVCRLVVPGITGLHDYLLKRLNENMGFEKSGCIDITLALIQSEYKDILQVVEKVINYNLKIKKRYYGYYFDEYMKVLKFLPKEYAKDLENIAKKFGGEVLEKFNAIVHS